MKKWIIVWTKHPVQYFFILPFFTALSAKAATCDPNTPYFCNPLNLGGDGIDTIADALIVAIQFLLSIVGLISLVFIVISGIKYITSSGNEESVKSAKDTLTASLTGLALALIAYGIVVALEEILRVR